MQVGVPRETVAEFEPICVSFFSVGGKTKLLDLFSPSDFLFPHFLPLFFSPSGRELRRRLRSTQEEEPPKVHWKRKLLALATSSVFLPPSFPPATLAFFL